MSFASGLENDASLVNYTVNALFLRSGHYRFMWRGARHDRPWSVMTFFWLPGRDLLQRL